MLRTLVALLLAANVGFFAWTQGWLDPLVGGASQGEREPERLKRQVRPEVVHLLPARPASAASAASASSTVLAAAEPSPATVPSPACLEAGPYADNELPPAEAALRAAGVPAGRWTQSVIERPGVWLVYMGRFADRDVQQRKAAELQHIRVAYEEVHGAPELEPGLSLGRFDDRAAADSALAKFAQHGVHTARVVALTPPKQMHLLRIDQPDEALQAQLLSLKTPALRSGFSPCAAAS
jgi:hypothetical protein